MKSAIIYGCGNLGKSAYYYLSGKYNIECFVDRDFRNQSEIMGLEVRDPEVLRNMNGCTVIVASQYYKEIVPVVEAYGVENIFVYGVQFLQEICGKEKEVVLQLEKRIINLGEFLAPLEQMCLKELTFIRGGSGVLDYAFLRKLAQVFKVEAYLEIGSYIGESANVLTDDCDKIYCVTAPKDAPFSASSYARIHEEPDYSNRLLYSDKIKVFYEDSRTFDYLKLPSEIDMYFIDGSHVYKDVLEDTKNVFLTRKEDSIVVWHDFKKAYNYNMDVIMAVHDALGDKFDNVYITDNNICGVYIPDKYKEYFTLREKKFEDDASLWVYDMEFKKSHIK